MIVQWRKIIFKINDFYGVDHTEEEIKKGDVHCYFQQHYYRGAQAKMSLHKQTRTLCIDLNIMSDQLKQEMNKTTRYEIKKAGKDDLTIQQIAAPTKMDVKKFMKFFNYFAAGRGIEKARKDKINSLRRTKRLMISYVYHKSGEKLAAHLYMINKKRTMLFYSAAKSAFNDVIKPQEISRANRYLHWQDMLFFKKKEFEIYDFFGLSREKDNQKQQNINKFKKGFGGEEENNYQSYIPQTLRGRMLVLMMRWSWRRQQELIPRNDILKNNQSNEEIIE